MGRTSSNRTSSSLLNLALAAFYLNLTFKNADGSHFYQVGPVVPYQLPPLETPAVVTWPDSFGRYSQAGAQGYGDYYRGGGGYKDGNGYYDDLMSSRNAYDIGKAYGGGQDYSKGSVAGGGYRDLSGRNKGHQAAGFKTSYRKDESGDKSTYYDDGLGHNARINYAAQDARGSQLLDKIGVQPVQDTVEGILDRVITWLSSPEFQGKGNVTRIEKERQIDPNTTVKEGFLYRYRDQGGAAKRGGYHDTNLNRNAIGNTGRYGDAYTYKGSDGGSHGYSKGSGYGTGRGYGGYGYGADKGYTGYGYGGDKGYTGYGYGADKGYTGYGYASPIKSYYSGYPGSFSGYYKPGYHRGGRLLPTLAPNETLKPLVPPPLPGPAGTTIKETGIYVIPMPDKLYFDPVPDF